MQRLAQRAISLLTHPDGLGYSVVFPYNPEGIQSDEVHLHDYRRWIQAIENHGRTWQRLRLLKSRYLAGNPNLAHRLFEEFPTLVYRRYLTRADIAGIGALNAKSIARERNWILPSRIDPLGQSSLC